MEFRDLKHQYKVLKNDIDEAVVKVCTNANFINGAQVKELEQELAQYVGAKHCIACANGTDALVLALMAWNVGPGDAVFVPDFTYFSSGEAVSNVGATPLFVDIDRDTYNIDPAKLEEAIAVQKTTGKYNLRAVVAVDLFGLPADYDAIKEICKKYDLLLLEDAAQGFGGRLHDKKACTFGDISTTSFFPAKPLGCYGDGGAVFTDNDEWADLIRSYAVHGKGSSKYDNVRIGMNSRLDTIQAAVLKVKLKAFADYELEDINKVAGLYDKEFEGTALGLPCIAEGFYSSWAQYTVKLPAGSDRDEIQKALKEKGIPSMVYYQKPMHVQKAFEGTDSADASCPVTEELCERVLSLPLHPYMSEDDVKMVARALKDLV